MQYKERGWRRSPFIAAFVTGAVALTAAPQDSFAQEPAQASSVQEPPSPRPTGVEPERRSPTGAYLLLGAGAVCLGAGAVFGIKAIQARSDFANGLKTDDQVDKIEQNALIADISLGTALAFGVTGALLLLMNPSHTPSAAPDKSKGKSPHASSLQVVPTFGPQHVAATAEWRF